MTSIGFVGDAFSFSVRERKIMNHFVVSHPFRFFPATLR